MEIINNNQVTPYRLHALVRLVPRLRTPKRDDFLELLQPLDLVSSQEASKEVYRAAINFRVIVEDENGYISLHPDIGKRQNIETSAGFCAFMQKRLTGIADENADNYLLNFVTAWYAVQNERIFQCQKKDEISQNFNKEMDPRGEEELLEEGRLFNPTKLNGWLTWASFLGWGWTVTVGGKELLMPDAHKRLIPVLPALLPDSQEIPFSQFAEKLAEICPELDGGPLFEKCWQASRSAELRGNQLSLMLSTGLRSLHDNGKIRLTHYADSSDEWQLYPAQAHPIQRVTHIQRKA
ncbi:MAG: hypothetical protein KJ063_07515 [Anaerolineae bacterium]|nr:hypothetical protein [Anaerolineae bacterium]